MILHFRNASLPSTNRLEVDLGYGTDVFTSSAGAEFWSRPINVAAFAGGTIPISYVDSGVGSGSVELHEYARGESLPGDPGHGSVSNSDPFLPSGSYSEPTYDPFWFCNDPPQWENVECVPAADVRRQVAQSVGMISTVHADGLSTCSVTCIGPDTVLTAGHCLADIDNEWPTSSVTFDYQTDCAGNAGAGYNPVFHKVAGYLKFRWTDVSGITYDYCILQLVVPPGGLGVPAVELRNSLPAVGEQVFGIHHPNGAIKKLSPPHTTSEVVNASNAAGIWVDIDISGGSSGSAIFDMSGRLAGVASFGTSCTLRYFPSTTILADIAATPAPSPDQDVMLVIDRSGSMSGDAGTGQSKIEEARDAASLFIQLIRPDVGHRAGMVSFATAASSPVDEALGNVNAGKKNQLIGPAPYSGGAIGSVTSGGWTSIGSGIDAAQTEFTGPGSNLRTMLILTDGLQNTPPMIDAAASDLGDVTVHAIGLGTEANLDGAILSNLAQSTGGAYTRAGDGLDLKKFFALAFGDIFEEGTLTDPIFDLPRDEEQTKGLEFSVCDEETITVVAGWDRRDVALEIVLTTPDGTTLTEAAAGTESSRGHAWVFLRVPLPLGGQREGTWIVHLRRVGGDGEFHAPPVPVRCFLNVVPSGGPTIKPVVMPQRLYTGDVITPLVWLGYANGEAVPDPSVRLTVTRPGQSAGNVLAEAGLGAPSEVAGDAIPPKQATLIALEADQGGPLFTYVDESFGLHRERELIGAFEHTGPWGRRFDDLLRVQGNYTFRAVGSYGTDCRSSREVTWTTYVATGIDEDTTEVTTTVVATNPDGTQRVRLAVVPKDRFGNLVGPGQAPDLDMGGIPGSTPVGPLLDGGDGSYTMDVDYDPGSDRGPGVSITQPDRSSACLEDHEARPGAGGQPTRPWLLPWLWLIIVVLLIVIVVLLVD